MKTKRVATQNASRLKKESGCLKNWQTIFFIALFLLVVSCDKKDDFDLIEDDSSIVDDPVINEPPIIEEPPVEDVPPMDEEPPNEEEPPMAEEPPYDPESFIVYTNIEPDFPAKNFTDFYQLDLNNDGIIDFTISQDHSESWEFLQIISNPNSGNGILSVSPWYTHPLPLKKGNKIFNEGEYHNGEIYTNHALFNINECFFDDPNCPYNWKGKGDMFIGLRIVMNGKFYYGWVQMNVEAIHQWVIKDYAFNSTTNKPIYAGQIK